ncbi:MAG: hypothetical protein PHX21_00855 [bacterium]|nr:hypothetical protein [bacterium]
MKKNCFFVAFILSIIFFSFLSSCSKTEPAKRWEHLFIDTTLVVCENDSIVWKCSRKPADIFLWSDSDSLYFEVIREYGPTVGRLAFSTYKEGSYEENRKDTTFNTHWYWKGDKLCDTIAIQIVNTSLNDTLKVKTKVTKIYWTGGYSYMP